MTIAKLCPFHKKASPIINTPISNTTTDPSAGARPGSAARPCLPRWFAAYTLPNHEKTVARQLSEKGITHYLPVYESVRKWKDRKMRLHMPLFPGYVFVHLPVRDRVRVVEVPSVVRMVGFGGEPAAIPEAELAAIRTCLEHKRRLEPHAPLNAGERVRITRGPLTGIEGILLRQKGVARLVLSVGLILRAAAVEVDISEIEPVAREAVISRTQAARGGQRSARQISQECA